VGVPCDGPAAGVTLTFSRAGAPPRRVRTDARGAYRLGLAAGVYTVRTDERPFGVVPQPARARVFRARFVRANFSIDTGIR
ncbi:MAG: hypothetical protein ACRDN6_00835, partial [Gaiellaceae bacterium]